MRPALIAGTAIGGAILFGVCVAYFASGESTREDAPTTSTVALEAWQACQAAERIVEDALRAPGTREWVGNCYTGSNYRITSSIEGGRPVWLVLGEVDAENGFGALIRSTFLVQVTDLGGGRHSAEIVSLD